MKENEKKPLDGEALCEAHEVHRERLAEVIAAMPCEEEILLLAELFKYLGEPSRMRILLLLSEGELCVCELSRALGASVSAVSHQLRILKQAHLVRSRREGKSILYSLSDAHVQTIVAMGLVHVRE